MPNEKTVKEFLTTSFLTPSEFAQFCGELTVSSWDRWARKLKELTPQTLCYVGMWEQYSAGNAAPYEAAQAKLAQYVYEANTELKRFFHSFEEIEVMVLLVCLSRNGERPENIRDFERGIKSTKNQYISNTFAMLTAQTAAPAQPHDYRAAVLHLRDRLEDERWERHEILEALDNILDHRY